MQSKQQQCSKILPWLDLTTSIYLSTLTGFLNYDNQLLKLGHYDNLYITVLIASAEIIKYTIYVSLYKTLPRKSLLKEIFKTITLSSTMFVVFYVVSVLFGAPVFSNFEQTSMFALLMTALAILPSSLFLGYDNTVNMILNLTSYQRNEVNEVFLLKLRATLFGAWLGAFVIPLDWKRPWQVWPIPCCLGGLLGNVIGNFVACIIQLGQNRRSSRKTGKYAL